MSKYKEECESKELDIIIQASSLNKKLLLSLKVEADHVAASFCGAEWEESY